MNIQENVSLREHSTMRLGGNAAYLCEITEAREITEALAFAREKNVPVVMIGDGSNIVWKDEGFPGLVLVNRIMRFEIASRDETELYLTVGAGEPWDSVVDRVVASGYSGIEALSLIPGTTGATPIQNVGAYGAEIADVLTTIEAYDLKQGKLVTIANSDCQFGYRTSRFKTIDHGQFFITAITLHLTKIPPVPPFYSALQTYFDQHNITERSAKSIREAVIKIRETKLPDPRHIANCGSFFANPIISSEQLAQLRAKFPEIVYWETENETCKVSGAWLVEYVGFRGMQDKETGMAIWPMQSLVMVNETAKNTADLLTFKQKIIDAVYAKFAIKLEQEPELLP